MATTTTTRKPISEAARKAKNARESERQKSPAEVAKRVARNKARRHALAAGTVSKGDGKAVDHIKMLVKGGSTHSSNTRVVDAKKNCGWRSDQPEAYGRGKGKK